MYFRILNVCSIKYSYNNPSLLGPKDGPLHNVYFVKYDVTVSFMAEVLDTVTYLVPQVLDTAS